ncbi:MAG: putative bacteriocin export ABC transporter [Tissierellia bacterium]|nr:putative bacteriocin export ABC transporter [Tissierellia bacterium]
MIKLENIEKRFGDKIIIKDLSLTIEEGESIVIVGKSGSGKSTLLNIMSLIEAPSSGRLLWDDKEVKVNSKKANEIIRNEIGYLFQNFALIDDESIEKNIKIAMKYNKEIKDPKDAIKKALIRVGLENDIKQKIYTLSGGEQQRVALARLLVKPCKVIFADEPTGNLDDKTSENIMNILFDLNKMGKTIVVVTHDTRHLESFDRIIEIGQDIKVRKTS